MCFPSLLVQCVLHANGNSYWIAMSQHILQVSLLLHPDSNIIIRDTPGTGPAPPFPYPPAGQDTAGYIDKPQT